MDAWRSMRVTLEGMRQESSVARPKRRQSSRSPLRARSSKDCAGSAFEEFRVCQGIQLGSFCARHGKNRGDSTHGWMDRLQCACKSRLPSRSNHSVIKRGPCTRVNARCTSYSIFTQAMDSGNASWFLRNEATRLLSGRIHIPVQPSEVKVERAPLLSPT